jgi:hypothetical protein
MRHESGLIAGREIGHASGLRVVLLLEEDGQIAVDHVAQLDKLWHGCTP